MNKQKTVDSKVLAILRECPETRYDDMQLKSIAAARKNFKKFYENLCFWVCILTPFVQMSEGVISPQGISPFKVP